MLVMLTTVMVVSEAKKGSEPIFKACLATVTSFPWSSSTAHTHPATQHTHNEICQAADLFDAESWQAA